MKIAKNMIGSYVITEHAERRMCGRRINTEMVNLVIAYGRIVHTKNAQFHVVGRREVEKYCKIGIDLRKVEGIHVVIGNEAQDAVIITVFRNNDFRGLRH